MSRVLLFLTLAPAAVLLLMMSARHAEPRADFVIASGSLRTIDPHRVSWLDEIQVANALFEGLTRLNAVDFQPEPATAAQWRIDDAGRTYTFKLRPDARWSNGDKVTAEDFRAGWLRVLDPQVEAQYASLLFVVEGAERFYRSRLDDDPDNDASADTVGVTAINEHTLEVRLGGPCSYFLDLAAFPTLAPAHRPTLRTWAYRDGQVLRGTMHRWTRPANIVCNGAFVLSRWDFKRRLLLHPNPYYWDRSAISMESIEVSIASEGGSAMIGYDTGRFDYVSGLEPEAARSLHATGRSDFHLVDRFATEFYRVNTRRAPLDNPDFRRALSLAIDKQAICEHILGLGEQPADTYVPKGALPLMSRVAPDGAVVYYEPPSVIGAGLSVSDRADLARACLARSGFDAAGGRAIELAFGADVLIQRRIAEAVQTMWERELGIRVELLTIERTVLSQRIRQLDYDLARSDWYGDFMDPATFLDMFTTTSGQNRTGWSHAEYDQLIATAAQTADNRARYATFQQAERILGNELPIIPLFFKRGNYLLRSEITGVGENIRGVLPFHRARWGEKAGRHDAR
jgi:oligopeptide transport system substrate-binding protein